LHPPVRRTTALIRRMQPRLWELLLEHDHRRFLDRLGAFLPARRVPAGAMVEIVCPTLELRYGRRDAWLPWNHPALAGEARRLINPKKTPLLVKDGNGTPLFHLRFVAEGPFGRAEYKRASAIAAPVEDCWLVDGYRVATHLGPMRPLRDEFAAADETRCSALIVRSGAILGAVCVQPLGRAKGAAGKRDVGKLVRRQLQNLADRFGLCRQVPDAVAWLGESRVPAFGVTGRPIRSSLRYSHGYWHWQVDPAGTVHRFQIDAGWGAISWPELELASFALENRLSAPLLRDLVVAAGFPPELSPAIVAYLPAAVLLHLDALAREVRCVDGAGLDCMRCDIADMWTTVSRLAVPSIQRSIGDLLG